MLHGTPLQGLCAVLIHDVWISTSAATTFCRCVSQKRKNGTACSFNPNFRDEKRPETQINESMNACQDYLVVGVALRIEGGERWGWDFSQPLSLWVRPCLVIKGNLRWFYLQCTDRAQLQADHCTGGRPAHLSRTYFFLNSSLEQRGKKITRCDKVLKKLHK